MQLPISIFRAYDIRGVVDDTLTVEGVYVIGQALGTCVLEAGGTHMVLGRDGRLTGPKLLDALSKGVSSTGCHVVEIGEVPTPVLYFATHHLSIPSGVMITGSHNPPEFNGLKIMLMGQAIYGKTITGIYNLCLSGQFQTGHGTIERKSVLQEYQQAVLENTKINRKLKIVVDCGNGVAGNTAPVLFGRMGCEVISLYCEIDGNFPNHHPDPAQPENLNDLIQAVKAHQADLGVAFDGDGDRLGVIDDQGKLIYSDRLLMLFAQDLLSRAPGATVIFDIKSSHLLNALITQQGGNPLLWKTGHSLIKAKMQETGALLAGEMSGHLFFKERWYGFDDGIYSGARLLEILSLQPECASKVFERFPENLATPEITLRVPDNEKFELIERCVKAANFPNAKITTLDGLRMDYDQGWSLVRASNTSPNLVLRFEASNQTFLDTLQREMRALLLSQNPGLKVPF